MTLSSKLEVWRGDEGWLICGVWAVIRYDTMFREMERGLYNLRVGRLSRYLGLALEYKSLLSYKTLSDSSSFHQAQAAHSGILILEYSFWNLDGKARKKSGMCFSAGTVECLTS